MSLFAHLKRDTAIEAPTDRAIGGGRAQLTSGVHTMTIEMAYEEVSSGGAGGLVLNLVDAQGRTYRGTEWVTSGTAKGGKHYYIDKDSGAQRYLPGFIVGNDIVRLTVDKELFELEPEPKTIMLYSYDLRKEVPTQKNVFTELIGKEITVGVTTTLEDKYKTPSESRSVLSIDKVFHTETGCTVVELESGMEEGTYIKTWTENNTPSEAKPNAGTRDKRVQSKPGANPQPSGSTSTAPTTSSKFGRKNPF